MPHLVNVADSAARGHRFARSKTVNINLLPFHACVKSGPHSTILNEHNWILIFVHGNDIPLMLRADMKRSASPKRHGMSQPVIKITATSSTVSSLNGLTAAMYSVTETRGE